MSWTQCAPGTKFHPNFPDQNPNSVWCYGHGQHHQGHMPPFLIKARYGEPICMRIYNNTPVDRDAERRFRPQRDPAALPQRAQRRGERRRHRRPPFPRHVLRLSLEHHARPRATRSITNGNRDQGGSGPDDSTGIVKVPGDWRELQGTLWAHDHRFFFTAENVYKGNLGMVNYVQRP